MSDSDLLRPGLSERLVLDAIRRDPGVSRAALADQLELSQQSIHRIVQGLTDTGLVMQERKPVVGRGQPSPGLRLQPGRAFGVGAVVNTDSAVLCLLDSAGTLVAERRRATLPLSRDTTLAWLAAETAAVLREHDVPPTRLLGVGVALNGFFYDAPGHVSASEPLHDWSMLDLRPLLETALGLPVTLLNNASAAAIGEETRGIGLRHRCFGYLHFHYGFGGGVVADGRLLWGAHRNAGELGVLYDRQEIGDRPALLSLLGMLRERGVDVPSLQALRDRFDPAWPGVAEWIDRVAPGLNRAVRAFAAILDPDAIVFGGAIPPELARLLMARVAFDLPYHRGINPPRPRLLCSDIEGDAAATGAACVPLKARLFSTIR